MRGVGVVVGLIVASAASQSDASAWLQPKGKGQVIVKLEQLHADLAYDAEGELFDPAGDRRDTSFGAFVEYGVTDRLTVQVRGDWQDGEEDRLDYRGRGPIEVGATWQVWRDDHTAVSLYGGYALAGEGRNAGYAAPGVGEQDWEVRAAVGRSFGGGGGVWYGPDRSFVEVQVARRMRDGLPDETRGDLTVGGHFGRDWMVLGQAFGGVTDGDGARWLSLETSVVRHQGDWSVQAGWRQAVAGRRTPQAKGFILAVWRRF